LIWEVSKQVLHALVERQIGIWSLIRIMEHRWRRQVRLCSSFCCVLDTADMVHTIVWCWNPSNVDSKLAYLVKEYHPKEV
jgi:hypothetical protein